MKIKATFLLLLAMLCGIGASAQVPERPNPPRLVNDFAGILGDTQALEDSLQAFAMQTSNQICVVTMNDFGGYDKAYMATEIGDKWGVGNGNNDNGIVILIKPKTETERGEAFIAIGRGLEGAITDASTSRIVNNEMIPHFKENDYRGGVDAALAVLKPLATGEFNEEDYVMEGELTTTDLIIMFCLLAFFMWLFFMMVKNSNNGGNMGGGSGSNRDTGTWGGPIIFTGGNTRSGGSWGGFGGGGGGPSWGGFGGGSFGGGGAGGSW